MKKTARILWIGIDLVNSYKHLHIYLLSKKKSLKIIEEVREQKGHYREV